MTTRPGLAAWDEALGAPETLPRAIRCEKTVVRQTPGARPPPVQPRSDDTRHHVGAGFGRRPSIIRGISANSRRGIATWASWNVTYRPCRTTLAPILTSLSRSVDRDYFTSVAGQRRNHPNARICDRCWLLSRHRCPAADPTLVYGYTTRSGSKGRWPLVGIERGDAPLSSSVGLKRLRR